MKYMTPRARDRADLLHKLYTDTPIKKCDLVSFAKFSTEGKQYMIDKVNRAKQFDATVPDFIRKLAAGTLEE